MTLICFTFLVLLLGCVCSAPSQEPIETAKKAAANSQDLEQEKDDLKTASSASCKLPPLRKEIFVCGRKKRRKKPTDTHRYSDWGSSGIYPSGYSGYGVTGYGTIDDKYNSYYGGGFGGYDNTYNSGAYPGYSGYAGNSGYGGYSKGYSGGNGLTGYGGYGGYGGNGGLNSYYGYSNPYYQGAYHLGYGYHNKRPGYGNIYQNGITPSLVTGYRGYSR